MILKFANIVNCTQTKKPRYPSPSLSLLNAVSAGNTKTRGIIEQRFVDAFAALAHPVVDGWHPRGLGDFVNATNVSRRKIGDCDFQHVGTKQAIGYETHAGILSAVYLNEHMRTLEKSLPSRLDEWSTYSDPAEWQLTVVFLAFGFKEGLPSSRVVSGKCIKLKYMIFNELPSRIACQAEGDVIAAFKQFVLNPLNSTNTPQFVRNIYSVLG